MKKYFLKYKKILFFYGLVSIIAAFLSAGLAFLYKNLTQAAIDKDFQKLMAIGIFGLFYLIIEASFDYFPRKYRSKILNNIMLDLKNDLIKASNMKNLEDLSLDFQKEMKNKMVNDLESIKKFLNSLFAMFLYGAMFFVSFISAIYIQGSLTMIMVVLSFIPFLSPLISKKILSSKKEKEIRAKGKYLEEFDEFNENILFIKISNIFNIFYAKLDKLGGKLRDKSFVYEASLGKTYAISYGLGNVLYSGTWIIGGIFVYKDLINLPSLIAMTTLVYTIAGPIQALADNYSELVSSKEIFLNYLKFIEIEEKNERKLEINSINSITYKDISLSYEKRIILEDINLSLKEREKYLIFGESGSGKSTFLKLSLGMFEKYNEKIFVNNLSLDKINKKSYYDKIYYIPQETIIFRGSIYENISLFDSNKNIEKCKKALEEVGLDKFIENRNLDDLIDKDKISGGEKKRIDLARAIYADKNLIIMDEPTSGLDLENENIIAEIIKNIEDKIVICVSHTKNEKFLNAFDKIIEIDNKKIKAKK